MELRDEAVHKLFAEVDFPSGPNYELLRLAVVRKCHSGYSTGRSAGR